MYADRQRHETFQRKFAMLRQIGSASKFPPKFKSLASFSLQPSGEHGKVGFLVDAKNIGEHLTRSPQS